MKMIRVFKAAQMLQVTPATIRNWIDAGHFPGARKANPHLKNSPYRIPLQEVEQMAGNLKIEKTE